MCYGVNTGSDAMGYTLNNIHVMLHKFLCLMYGNFEYTDLTITSKLW